MINRIRATFYEACLEARRCARDGGIRKDSDFFLLMGIAQWSLTRKADPWLNVDMMIALSDMPRTTVQRSLARLHSAGMVRSAKRGPARLYTLNTSSPAVASVSEAVNHRVLPILGCSSQRLRELVA